MVHQLALFPYYENLQYCGSVTRFPFKENFKCTKMWRLMLGLAAVG